MRFTAVCTTILAIIAPAIATINNKAVAKKVDKQSFHIKPGKYRFVNYKTHQGIKYVRSNQQLFTAKGKGDYMSIRMHHKHIVVSPSASNKKCMNAQWNYSIGANGAAALYRCHRRRDDIPLAEQIGQELEFEVLDFEDPSTSQLVIKAENATVSLEKRDPPLRDAKQYFYVMPGHFKGTVQIIAYDHITDMATRCLGSTSHTAPYNKHSRLQDIVKCNPKDKGSHWQMFNSKGRSIL